MHRLCENCGRLNKCKFVIAPENIAFAAHFYGQFPGDLMQRSSRELNYWVDLAIDTHNKLNKIEEKGS